VVFLLIWNFILAVWLMHSLAVILDGEALTLRGVVIFIPSAFFIFLAIFYIYHAIKGDLPVTLPDHHVN
jgi:hypothetical protein